MSYIILHKFKSLINVLGLNNSPVFVKETVSLPPDLISLELKLHDSTILNKGQKKKKNPGISSVMNSPYLWDIQSHIFWYIVC